MVSDWSVLRPSAGPELVSAAAIFVGCGHGMEPGGWPGAAWPRPEDVECSELLRTETGARAEAG